MATKRNLRDETLAEVRGRPLPVGLQPLVPGRPVMGPERPQGMAPAGAQPGRTLAQRLGASDPTGYNQGTDTYTPGIVRSEIDQSRLQKELPYQQDRATASRMNTPESRESTFRDLSTQRIANDSTERIQAMQSASDVASAQARAEGNIRMSENNAIGKDMKDAELIGNRIYAINNQINDYLKTSGDTNSPFYQGLLARRVVMEKQLDRRLDIPAVPEAGGGGEYDPADIDRVRSQFPDWDEAKVKRYIDTFKG